MMNRTERWILCCLLLALAVGTLAHARQQELSGKLIRLHVVAEDDTDLSQARKLLVRDRILNELESLQAGSADEAETQIRTKLPALRAAAQETLALSGSSAGVRVSLEREQFPTREYETFALPAGAYTTLRVTLGDGSGKNWWCVAFPPLCLQAVSALEEGELDDRDWSLISLEDGYSIRFRILDWTEKLLSFFTQS